MMNEKEKSVFRSLDGIQALRAIASILVVFTHSITGVTSHTASGLTSSLFRTAAGGQWTIGDAGVDLFFVISGFIMVSAHKQDFGKVGSWRGFVLKRLVRIAPIYWILTTLVLGLLLYFPYVFKNERSTVTSLWVISSYLFISPSFFYQSSAPVLGVGWTLSYEAFFYAVFAISLSLPLRAALLSVNGCFISLIIVGEVFSLHDSSARFFFDWLILDFAGGMIIGYGYACGIKYKEKLRRCVLSLSIIALSFTIWWPAPEHGCQRFFFWGLPCVFIVMSSYDYKISYSALRRGLNTIGSASYSVYLVQVFAIPTFSVIFVKMRVAALSIDVAIGLVSLASVCSGVIFWSILERPIDRFLRKKLLQAEKRSSLKATDEL